MPIKVQCACGKAFAAKDELAGKTVKCPACKQPLKIPGAASSSAPAAKAASKPAAAKPAAKPAGAKPAAAAPAVGGAGDLFDEIGLQAAAPDTTPCPGCTEPMPIAAVVCIKCGYNKNLGRRMQTMKMSGEGGGHDGHGAVAQELLNRAAQVIDEDAAEEVKKTSQGVPWWVFFIALLLLVCFAAGMLLLRGKEPEGDDKKKGLLEPRVKVERALASRKHLSASPKSAI